MKEGDEKSLLATKCRKDTLSSSGWIPRLRSFFFSPEISRATPGKESVSIRRGVHAPKFLLKMSRSDAVKAFKVANPDYKFSASTLLRAVPQNCVLPKARDFQRNVCSIHSNVRYLMEAV